MGGPAFILLGESAAVAAAQAIDEDTAVQNIDYPTLKKTLLEKGQILICQKPE